MEENSRTQKNMVLMHLQSEGSITSMEAIMQYGIMRLAGVIWRLRKEGWRIDSVTEYGVNRYGRKVPYARYVLEDQADDERL